MCECVNVCMCEYMCMFFRYKAFKEYYEDPMKRERQAMANKETIAHGQRRQKELNTILKVNEVLSIEYGTPLDPIFTSLHLPFILHISHLTSHISHLTSHISHLQRCTFTPFEIFTLFNPSHKFTPFASLPPPSSPRLFLLPLLVFSSSPWTCTPVKKHLLRRTKEGELKHQLPKKEDVAVLCDLSDLQYRVYVT